MGVEPFIYVAVCDACKTVVRGGGFYSTTQALHYVAELGWRRVNPNLLVCVTCQHEIGPELSKRLQDLPRAPKKPTSK